MRENCHTCAHANRPGTVCTGPATEGVLRWIEETHTDDRCPVDVDGCPGWKPALTGCHTCLHRLAWGGGGAGPDGSGCCANPAGHAWRLPHAGCPPGFVVAYGATGCPGYHPNSVRGRATHALRTAAEALAVSFEPTDDPQPEVAGDARTG